MAKQTVILSKQLSEMQKRATDNSKIKVAVGMSGGVDSTMTAYLLKKRGYHVLGLTMQVWDGKHSIKTSERCGCYGPGESEDIQVVKESAQRLGIPHFVIPLGPEFQAQVIDYFCNAYLAGQTPNPCAVCNRKIKFGLLLEKARALGIEFDFFATGHYARVEFDEGRRRYLLKRGMDISKDQSYFLARLSQEQLSKLLLLLGTMKKDEIKALARKSGMAELADRKESQDFIDGSDYAALFKPGEIKPGPIVDSSGKELGQHRGIIHYTIGQRKQLGLSGRKQPLYVLRIDSERNTIVVGDYRDLFSDRLRVDGINWIAIDAPRKPLRVKAKIRQQHKEADAVVTPLDESGTSARIVFDKAQMSIAPGQTVVFYQDDIVMGGGVIAGI